LHEKKVRYRARGDGGLRFYGTRVWLDGGGRIHADLPFLMVMSIAPSWEAA